MAKHAAEGIQRLPKGRHYPLSLEGGEACATKWKETLSCCLHIDRCVCFPRPGKRSISHHPLSLFDLSLWTLTILSTPYDSSSRVSSSCSISFSTFYTSWQLWPIPSSAQLLKGRTFHGMSGIFDRLTPGFSHTPSHFPHFVSLS